jgi:CBS domain containing-hemolysin-like protein
MSFLLLLFLGLLLLFYFGWQERTRVLEAETAILPESDAVTWHELPKRFAVSVLAARMGVLVGVSLTALAWVNLYQTTYGLLRILGWSRSTSSALLFVAPLALIILFFYWVGWALAERRALSLTPGTKMPAWVGYGIFPFIPIATLLNKLASLTNTSPELPPDLPTQLRAIAAAPDPVWQALQSSAPTEASAANRQIFENAAELPTIRVRECMVYRTDIVGVEEEDGIEGLRQGFISSGYSKVPVFNESLDNVIGYCHSSALFKKPRHIADILQPMLVVPESMTASQLLLEFARAKTSMALVLDEYGGTSGLVTREDVMEEIFGEINDELDTDAELEVQEEPGQYLLSARLEVDYLNEKYDLDLPVGDYESLAGLVLSLNQDLPSPGQIITAAPFSFEILSMEQTRIVTLRLRVEE